MRVWKWFLFSKSSQCPLETVALMTDVGIPHTKDSEVLKSSFLRRTRLQSSSRRRKLSFVFRFQFKKNLRRIISQLYIRDNCHPFKASLLVWVQLPLWISLSLALRNLSLDQSGKLALILAQADPDQSWTRTNSKRSYSAAV